MNRDDGNHDYLNRDYGNRDYMERDYANRDYGYREYVNRAYWNRDYVKRDAPTRLYVVIRLSPLVLSQAPQHFRSSEAQAICDNKCSCQSIYVFPNMLQLVSLNNYIAFRKKRKTE